MKLLTKKGATSYLVTVFIQDSSSTTGAGLTGLTSGSSGLVCYRARADDGNAGGTQITLSGGTRGTWSSGGFVEKDSSNMPGVYELGIPNAAIASGSDYAIVMLKGATNQAPTVLEIQLVGFDPDDSVRLGLTALPNAAAQAAGGLYTQGSGAGQINQPANGQIDINVVKWNGTAVASPATAGIPDINVKNIAGSAVSTSSAQLGVNVVTYASGQDPTSALASTSYGQPAQGSPPASTNLAAQIGYLYKAWRNKTTQTATTYSLLADDSTTVDHKSTVSDDGTTFARTKIVSGP